MYSNHISQQNIDNGFRTKFIQALRDIGVDIDHPEIPIYIRQRNKIYELLSHVKRYEQIKEFKNGDILVKVTTGNGQKGKFIITTNGDLIRQ